VHTEFFYTEADAISAANTGFLQCVVARYNEDTEWMNSHPWNTLNILCYNKGPRVPDNCTDQRGCKVVSLPNVGRESHTYLYHIINNYDNLAEVTLFMPGSWMLENKRERTLSTLRRAIESRNTVFEGMMHSNVLTDLYDFKLEEWKSTNSENATINPEKALEQSPIRPFGKWYEANFGNTEIQVVSYFGIFAVSRQHIRQHPKAYYEKLLTYVDKSSNPEVGHYLERAWGAVFYPYPISCVYG